MIKTPKRKRRTGILFLPLSLAPPPTVTIKPRRVYDALTADDDRCTARSLSSIFPFSPFYSRGALTTLYTALDATIKYRRARTTSRRALKSIARRPFVRAEHPVCSSPQSCERIYIYIASFAFPVSGSSSSNNTLSPQRVIRPYQSTALHTIL